jgi:hypothetical protein
VIEEPFPSASESIAMTFRETLDKHLKAIKGRDLRALIETLPDEALTLIMSDGRLVTTVPEFVELHRGSALSRIERVLNRNLALTVCLPPRTAPGRSAPASPTPVGA